MRLRPSRRSWPRHRLVAILVASISLAAASTAHAATITVNTNSDSSSPLGGLVSLREAIMALDAGNALGELGIIDQLPGLFGVNDTIVLSSPETISVGSGGLPAITTPLTIDATAPVTLDGTSAGSAINGLTLGSGSAGSTIEGMTIQNFSGNGIEIDAPGGNTISGNTIEDDAGYAIYDTGSGDTFLSPTGSPNSISDDGAGISVANGGPQLGQMFLTGNRTIVVAPFTNATPNETVNGMAYDNADGNCEAATPDTRVSSTNADASGDGILTIPLTSQLPAGHTVSVMINDPSSGDSSALGCPNIYQVTNSADSGFGSLRQAILDSNSGSSGGQIQFNVGPVGSEQTISPASALPAVTTPVTFDGFTQGGLSFLGAPLITVDGGSAGSPADGLSLADGSAGSTVEGLDLADFAGNGLSILQSGGTNVVGDAFDDNGGYGIDDGGGGDSFISQLGIPQNSFSFNGLGGLSTAPSAPKLGAVALAANHLTATIPFTGATPDGTVIGLAYVGASSCQGSSLLSAPVVALADDSGAGSLVVPLLATPTGQLSVLLYDTTGGGEFVCSDFVTSTADSGAGSLRQAILNANSVSLGGDQINFAIGTAGSQQTISPSSALPAITTGAVIDGLSQGPLGYSGPPLVELNGSSAPNANGLTVEGPSTVEGLDVGDFTSTGLPGAGGNAIALLQGSAGSTLTNDYLGADPSGLAAAPNTTGVWDTTGDDTIENSVISGNSADGVDLEASQLSPVSGVQIANDQIGVGSDGSTPLGNGGNGVFVNGATHTLIQSIYGDESSIANNGGYGIKITAPANSDNTFRHYSVSGNGLGSFSVSGPTMTAIATLSGDGHTVTVKVKGASPDSTIAGEAGIDTSCHSNESFLPFASNLGTAQTDQNGDATMTIPVLLPGNGDGVRVLVTDLTQGTYAIAGCGASAPSASISSPASGGLYSVGQSVSTSFSCTEGTYGPGITTCLDSGDLSNPAGELDTSTPGRHTYSVTATSLDGLTSEAQINYTVAAAPSAQITSPASRAIYVVGQAVSAGYACSDGTGGPGIRSCAGPVPSGTRIDTTHTGAHTFSVTATSTDGQTFTKAVTYTVAAKVGTTKGPGPGPGKGSGPSNAFTVKQLKAARSGGGVTFTIVLPGAGALKLLETSGKTSFAKKSLSATGAKSIRITLKPSAGGKKLLRKHHKLSLTLVVTFTPRGGSARSKTLHIKVKR